MCSIDYKYQYTILIISLPGLLDYQLTVQLRSLRKEHWDDQFRHVDCREGSFDGGYANFIVVKPDQRIKINVEEFVYPWKTDMFKGKVKVCWSQINAPVISFL